MLYIHETTELPIGQVDRFVELFSGSYQPLMERQGARLVALWEGLPISSRWQQAIALWELDDFAHLAAVGRAQHQDPQLSPQYRAWRRALGEFAHGGEGRILVPSPHTPTLAQHKANGLSAAVCVHERITTVEGKQREYVEALERAYVPWAARTGRKWVGSYITYWRNAEVLHIWAWEKGWDTLAEKYPSSQFVDDDFRAWMTDIGPSLRHDWDDMLLQALPPTPLR